jgi:hypothetical protein
MESMAPYGQQKEAERVNRSWIMDEDYISSYLSCYVTALKQTEVKSIF